MTNVVTFKIDMDKPCTSCGVMGAGPGGICLDCAAEQIAEAKSKREELRFTKIKIKVEDAKVRINLEWQKKNGQNWDDYTMNSHDAPAPSFHAAMQALAQDVTELCEFPEDYKNRILVKGVSFSFGGDSEVMGATITAAMELANSNAPLNLNTPFKTEEFYSDAGGDPKQLLDPACSRRLHMLMIEAEMYVNGVRQQVDMFEGQKVAA